MSNTFPIIEGGYVRDIHAQPRALEETVNGLELSPALQEAAAGLAARRFERVVLTGMGGSFWALQPLYLQLLKHGRTALMVETSELIHVLPEILDRRTLLVVVSQSGRSAETVRLFDARQPECFMLAVTNTPDSPLAERADATVLTRAGEEFTVSCKTYVAALVALQWVADVLTARDLGRSVEELSTAAPAAAAYLAGWREHVQEAAEELKDARDLFLLGRGSSIATAGTGGLIAKESAHFHSEGMSSAAFRHGPFEMLHAGIYALVFEGDPALSSLHRRLVEDIREAGARASLVGEAAGRAAFRLPHVPASVRPVLEILPVEMVTLALAAMAGREAGKFERATKVTTTE